MKLRIIKRGSQNNWDRITKRKNKDHIFVEDDVNNILKDTLDYTMFKNYHGDNNVQEVEYNIPILKQDDCKTLQDENALQKEDDYYDTIQDEDEDKSFKEEEAGNTLKETEEDKNKDKYFQEEEDNTSQDHVKAKYLKGRNEGDTPVYKLCTSFDCWGPRMLKVWKKRDGGRATSGSWSPSGKRNGGRFASGSWNHFWNHMGES